MNMNMNKPRLASPAPLGEVALIAPQIRPCSTLGPDICAQMFLANFA